MTNRLLQLKQAIRFPIAVVLLVLASATGYAQQGFFNFTPPANNIIPANPCAAAVSNLLTLPTVSSTVGATITMSMFDPVASGYQYTDLWPAPFNNLIVSWFVKDDQGHSANFIFTVNILDVTAPVFDLTGVPATISYNSIVQVPPFVPLPVTDNCFPPFAVTQTLVQTTPPDTCATGVFTRTWTATDIAGNSTVFTQTITILQDILPPAIAVFPQNGASPCSQLATAYPAWLATQMANFSATDASGIKSYTNNAPATYPPGCKNPIQVTFWATDNCLIATPVTVTYTTSDPNPPYTVTPPKDTVAYCSAAGTPFAALGQWISKRGYSISKDSCTEDPLLTYEMRVNGVLRDSAQVVAALIASFSNACDSQMIGNQMYPKVRGKVRVTFFAKDACGNIHQTGAADFGVIDTLKPVITGANIIEQCGGNDNAVLTSWINARGNAVISDACSTTTWDSFSWVTSNGQTGSGIFNVGPYPAVQAHNCNWWVDVTFKALDQCGNAASIQLRFQIQDSEKPVIAGFPAVIILPCTSPIPSLSPGFVTDNCDTSMVIAFSAVNSDSLCDGSYTRTVTWSATDDCGNTGTAIQTVLVRDMTGPVFTLVPAGVTFYCDTFVLPPVPVMGLNIQATDACSPVVAITTQTTSFQNPNPALASYYNYNILRVFTATDECGNTTTATQTIQVVDNQGPVFFGFTDTTSACDIPLMFASPVAIDACSGPTNAPFLQSQVNTPGPCPNSYTVTYTWTATDVTGNITSFSQDILLLDTVAPILSNIPAPITVECTNIPLPPANGVVTGVDNCAANISISFLETQIRNPNTADCEHWTDYIIRRQWTTTDLCGNSRVYTQNIQVQDVTGPVMTPPVSLVLPADPSLCSATFTVPPPISLYDVCTSTTPMIELRDTALLVTTSGGNPLITPVDTLVFQWNIPNPPPTTPVIGPASLTLILENADANDPMEFFRIYGEQGYPIGTTTLTSTPCGNKTLAYTINANLLNSWLSDGQLTLLLAPNGAGGSAVNPVCSNGRVRAILNYTVAQSQVPVTLTYSIDNGPNLAYPPSGSTQLPTGLHQIVYTATDCAGNSSTVSSTIDIQDQQAPVVTAPAPIITFVGSNNCTATVALPFPSIFENCAVSGSLVLASGLQPLEFENTDAGTVPKDITLLINGLIPNAVGNGVLKIRHRGDNATPGEFFTVKDETGTVIDTTTLGQAAFECANFHETEFLVTANNINAWALTGGNASFSLEANQDVLNYNDFINPCPPSGASDGTSIVQAVLEYNFATVNYTITNNATGLPAVAPGTLINSQTSVTLSPGIYTVQYMVTDNSGLTGMSSYQITIRDTIKPTANCLSTTIQTNPSGLLADVFVLQASVINNGSSDNCSGPLSFQLSQTNFNCNMATPPNNIYPVTLTVTDASGNSASCTANVRVEIAPLQPYYLPVCEGDTLKLFTDPLLPDPNNIYTFQWKNPSGVQFAINRNPIIPNVQVTHEGIYMVSATGSTGCVASGIVDVVLVKLPTVPILNTNSPVCFGDSIHLSTPSYSASNVYYLWYSVDPLGNATLLNTTQVPFYDVLMPMVGNYQYYVKVTGNGCSSVNSLIVGVTVKPRPVATVASANISVCQGEAIQLSSTSSGMSSYVWMGPNGYMATGQNPPVIQPADTIHDGLYKLEVFLNGCKSLPVFVDVEVRKKPIAPGIIGATQLCEGSDVTLVTTGLTQASSFLWSNGANVFSTAINSLTINDISLSDAACWRVLAIQNGCLSDWSAQHCISVQAYPDVVAPANMTVCAYDTIRITPTSNITIANWCWTGPGNLITFEQTLRRFPPIAGQYKIIGKTSFGCSDSAFVEVTVPLLPVIDLVSNNAPPCPDGTTDATLQATISNASPGMTYAWYFPDLSTLFSTDPMPVIPDVAADDNGTYTLIVKDANGCASAPNSTVISIGNPLPVPNVKVNNMNTDTVCQGSTIVLSVQNFMLYANPATYNWTLPNNTITTTTTPTLTLTNVAVNQTGLYRVQVASAGCLSPSSGAVYLKVNPIPPTPNPESNSPVCFGDKLLLWVQPQSTDPTAEYFWSGPNGLTFNLAGPMVMPVDESYEGSWTVKLTINGCISNAVEPVEVVVKDKPKTPQMLPLFNNRICREAPGAKVQLQINVNTATPGALYTWIYQGDTLAGPATSSSYMSNGLSQFQPGENTFRVIANLNGCNSLFSDSLSVFIDTIPNNMANAGTGGIFCISEMLRLNAEIPSVGAGIWTKVNPSGASISNPTDPNTAVDDIIANFQYQFAWTLSNGACLNYDSDTVTIQTVAPDTARVTQDLYYGCAEEELLINAVQGKYSKGFWTQDGNQAGQLMIGIETPDSTVTYVNNLVAGSSYFFYWNLPDVGCGASSDTVVVRNYSGKPFAGNDRAICVTDPCENLLATTLQSFESGMWSAVPPGPVFGNPFSNATSVCQLRPGPNVLVWTTNNGACGNLSKDTVVIDFQLFPTAIADTVPLGYGQNVLFNVLDNDDFSNLANLSVNITTPPTIGTLGNTTTQGQYTYQASNGFSGTTTMIYTICNLLCPTPACSANTVSFMVGDPGDCVIPTIITPNNDNINDTFIIPTSCAGADGLEEMEVLIMNEWGDKVFYAKPYNNATGWDGTHNGQDLPAGTYYFSVKLTNSSKPLGGFVLIQR